MMLTSPQRRLILMILFALPLLTQGAASPAWADDKVIIGTDWRAEAEHGGLYQALATGIYKKYHLDVEIRQGGPNLNQAQLLAAGRYDFSIQSNSFEPLNFAKNNVPIVMVAAAFQKDPQVLITHRATGRATIDALKGLPILISAASRENFWQFLKRQNGFTDDQIRPYTYNLAPFLVDQNAVMQGYLTSEPYAIELASGEKPITILLADQGYQSYAALIATRSDMIQNKPDLVQRVVDATMEGWDHYLKDDPTPAHTLIKRDNPEMTDALLNNARDAINREGLVRSGDAETLGLGAMSDARWESFTRSTGVYPADLDPKKAYTLRFVNRGTHRPDTPNDGAALAKP